VFEESRCSRRAGAGRCVHRCILDQPRTFFGELDRDVNLPGAGRGGVWANCVCASRRSTRRTSHGYDHLDELSSSGLRVGPAHVRRTSAVLAATPVHHVRREVFGKPSPRDRCPLVDLPTSNTSHWGAGVTADEMDECNGSGRGSLRKSVSWNDRRMAICVIPRFPGLRPDKITPSVERREVRFRSGSPDSRLHLIHDCIC
jgi:hypothetical protein